MRKISDEHVHIERSYGKLFLDVKITSVFHLVQSISKDFIDQGMKNKKI